MTKAEIQNALEIAVSRGESIEKATQSMINAGYSKQEVQAAAVNVQNSGAIGITGQMPTQSKTESIQKETTEPIIKSRGQNIMPTKQAVEEQPAQTQTPDQSKPKKKGPWKVLILVGILVVLLIVLGFIIFG